MKNAEMKKGFTLIEVTMVVVIIAVVAAATTPRVTGLVEVQGNLAARKMLADLRYAQRLAMDTRKIYGVQLDPANDRYRVFDTTTGLNATDPLTGSVGVSGQTWSSGFVVSYPDHSELKAMDITVPAGAPATEIRFNPLGTPLKPDNSEGGSITWEMRHRASSGGPFWQVTTVGAAGSFAILEG